MRRAARRRLRQTPQFDSPKSNNHKDTKVREGRHAPKGAALTGGHVRVRNGCEVKIYDGISRFEQA